MTTAAQDYDAAVTALRTQHLPAYVEYTRTASAHGIAGANDPPRRIVVDVRSKKIVSVTPQSGDWSSDDSPITQHLFDPSCYSATGERTTNWNGHDVIAINVSAKKDSCDDLSVHTIFADASSRTLLGADGSETDEGMTVDFSVQYVSAGGYIIPSALSAHAHGHGWLFWARERAEVRYSNYNFTNERRQASSP